MGNVHYCCSFGCLKRPVKDRGGFCENHGSLDKESQNWIPGEEEKKRIFEFNIYYPVKRTECVFGSCGFCSECLNRKDRKKLKSFDVPLGGVR